jgi:hypothetical protein
MKPILATAILAALLLTLAAPTAARADRGWRYNDGDWFYYTDINDMRHWYFFDPTPGKWLYWDDGAWRFISSYRPLQVFVAKADLRRLPASFVTSPNFQAAPNRVVPQIDPLVPDVFPDAEVLDQDADEPGLLDDARSAVRQLPPRSGWLRRWLLRRRR